MSGYRAPRPLEAADHLGQFACRSVEQTRWLRDHARQSVASGSTKVMVTTHGASGEVVAYYAWRMAHLELAASPGRLRRGGGRYPQPVALLARLGVDQRHEGRGLGAGLLVDVVIRLLDISEDIGCRGLLVHAETDEAKDFYLHLVPELLPSPTDPLHLVLLMKDARRTFGS